MKTRLIAASLITFVIFNTVKGADSESFQTDTIWKNWKSTTSESLRNPANSKVIPVLRKYARDSADQRAQVLLLNLQDPEIVSFCNRDFHKADRPYDRAAAANTFALCSEPQLMLLFIDDLNRAESTKSSRVAAGEEVVRITPLSVLATEVIRGIIIHSPQFTQSVKDWAASLPKGSERIEDRDKARTLVRLFWQQNEPLLRSQRYTEVRPPAQ